MSRNAIARQRLVVSSVWVFASDCDAAADGAAKRREARRRGEVQLDQRLHRRQRVLHAMVQFGDQQFLAVFGLSAAARSRGAARSRS